MEALIVTGAALLLCVFIEASSLAIVGLLRWSPIIAGGLAAGLLAQRFGADATLMIGFGVCIVTRSLLRHANRRVRGPHP